MGHIPPALQYPDCPMPVLTAADDATPEGWTEATMLKVLAMEHQRARCWRFRSEHKKKSENLIKNMAFERLYIARFEKLRALPKHQNAKDAAEIERHIFFHRQLLSSQIWYLYQCTKPGPPLLPEDESDDESDASLPEKNADRAPAIGLQKKRRPKSSDLEVEAGRDIFAAVARCIPPIDQDQKSAVPRGPFFQADDDMSRTLIGHANRPQMFELGVDRRRDVLLRPYLCPWDIGSEAYRAVERQAEELEKERMRAEGATAQKAKKRKHRSSTSRHHLAKHILSSR